MKYRQLGNTDLSVSEIGLGGEWLERQDAKSVKAIIDACAYEGINILDCWMSEPDVRTNIGSAIANSRDKWIIQGHIGSTWQRSQYVRTRDMAKVKSAFEDLLVRLKTDYIDIGMIHFVDEPDEYASIMSGDMLSYVLKLKASGTIRHIGLSTHNPEVALMAASSGIVEMLLFSVNPAFDMLPAVRDLNVYFAGDYSAGFSGIAPEREKLYRVCETNGIGINVMKGYAGGRLFNSITSPFGVTLTPVQCIHYALTRPAVTSVLAGFTTVDHVKAAVAYESATDAEKDYASVLASAPRHAFSSGQCTYCGHCAPCPSGIDIAMVNKLCDLAAMHERVPATLKAHYSQLKAGAGDCIECGGCETRCPFGVEVIAHMKKARDLFC